MSLSKPRMRSIWRKEGVMRPRAALPVQLKTARRLTPKFKYVDFGDQCVYSVIASQLRTYYNYKCEPERDKTHPEFLRETIARNNMDAVCVIDLGAVISQYQLWKRCLPTVRPFYAVKAYPDLNIMRVLHLLGAGFDCASSKEIEMAQQVGASVDSIIFANPAKGPRHINYAKKQGVKLMTFDNETELNKILNLYPNSELVIRIASNDSMSLMPFGYKFGCSLPYAKELVQICKSRGANLKGVSFHVGSGCYDVKAYSDTLNDARELFDFAEDLGIKMTLLDIGGGWPGSKEAMSFFEEICHHINPILSNFPEHVKIIAEPGRFFCTRSLTLALQISSERNYLTPKKDEYGVPIPGENMSEIQYYLTDGAYGCFNNTVWDHAGVQVIPLFEKGDKRKFGIFGNSSPTLRAVPTVPVHNTAVKSKADDAVDSDHAAGPATKHCTTLFGPTCDSLDVIVKRMDFPKMEIGDWLYFPNMGAYTFSARSNFNGFDSPAMFYKIFFPTDDE